MVVRDCTSQKFIHLCQGRPYGLLLYLDEMNHWIQRQNDPRSGDDRGAWIAGFEVGPYSMDRVTAGEIRAECVGLSIYGNLQPQVFKQHMAKMATDGLLQRFIPVKINSELTRKAKPIPTWADNSREYEELIRRMRTLPVRAYSLSHAAAALFDAFEDWYLDLNRDERWLQSSETAYRTALGKLTGTCARFALMLHLIDHPYDQEVSADTMERAVLITKGFVWPCLRYAFASTTQNELEQWVIEHIVQCSGEMESITVGQIKRNGRSFFERRKDEPLRLEQEIKVTCDHLCDHGYLILLEENRKTTRYAINPTIATQFRDYRERIIRAKAAARDRMVDVSRSIIKREPAFVPVIGERSLKTN